MLALIHNLQYCLPKVFSIAGALLAPGYLLGTRVPNLGAPLGILMVAGVA